MTVNSAAQITKGRHRFQMLVVDGDRYFHVAASQDQKLGVCRANLHAPLLASRTAYIASRHCHPRMSTLGYTEFHRACCTIGGHARSNSKRPSFHLWLCFPYM